MVSKDDGLNGSMNLHGDWDPDHSDSEKVDALHDSFGSSKLAKKKKERKHKGEDSPTKSPKAKLSMKMVGMSKQNSGKRLIQKSNSGKRLVPKNNSNEEMDWFFPEQKADKDMDNNKEPRKPKSSSKRSKDKYHSRRSSMDGRVGRGDMHKELVAAAKAEKSKSRRRSAGGGKVSSESKTQHSPTRRKPSVMPLETKKQTLTRQRKPMRDIFTILDIEPWSSDTKYTDKELMDAIEADPDACKKKYRFEFFGVVIFPFSMMCAIGSSLEAIQMCYDAFPEALREKDPWVGSPLHYACGYEGPADVVEWLLNKEISMVTTINRLKRSPFHIACQFSPRKEILKALLDIAPIGLEATDKYGNTALHLACENNAPMDVVELMVTWHTDAITFKNQSGSTPLHLGLENRLSPSKMKLLVKERPGVLELCDAEGRCPLHIAVENECDGKVIKFLARSNLNTLKLRTEWMSETPLGMAKRLNFHYLVEILESAEAQTG